MLAIAFAALTLAACNDSSDNTATETNDANSTTMDTNMDTTTTTTTSTSTNMAYTPGEGDVTYRERKVQVYRNGAWAETDEDVRLDNGAVVGRNGRVTREGKEIELEDGEIVNKTGNFFDRAGNTLEKGWDKTKAGVREAGKDVGNAAEKAGDKIKDAVTDDEKE